MDGSIGVHSEILSFLSVYIFKAHTSVWLRTYNLENTLYFKNVSNQGRKVSGPCYEETVMKRPKKVIEKISLPLMFVTFVMAVLVFAVSPVSAQDAQLCDGLNFCDRDDDTYIRDHKKCRHCDPQEPLDCDDNDQDFSNDCENDVTPSTEYTAKLTSGAFIFVGGAISVTPGSNKGIGLEPVYVAGDAEMQRPIDPVKQATWDSMFTIGCPNLEPIAEDDTGKHYVDTILSSSDDWTIEEPGNIRVILRDIELTDSRSVKWDVTVQLIGPENYDPYPETDWLPTVGDSPHTFELTRGRMWGREVRGGQGGRMSCYSGGSDVGIFPLGDSVLEIAIP